MTTSGRAGQLSGASLEVERRRGRLRCMTGRTSRGPWPIQRCGAMVHGFWCYIRLDMMPSVSRKEKGRCQTPIFKRFPLLSSSIERHLEKATQYNCGQVSPPGNSRQVPRVSSNPRQAQSRKFHCSVSPPVYGGNDRQIRFRGKRALVPRGFRWVSDRRRLMRHGTQTDRHGVLCICSRTRRVGRFFCKAQDYFCPAPLSLARACNDCPSYTSCAVACVFGVRRTERPGDETQEKSGGSRRNRLAPHTRCGQIDVSHPSNRQLFGGRGQPSRFRIFS